MKIIYLSLILLLGFSGMAQNTKAIAFQKELNESFKNPEESPLPKEKIADFEGLPFFPINEELVFKCKLVKAENAVPFQMKTSTERLADYVKYGDLHFEYRGQAYQLAVYQNLKLMKDEKYSSYLFLPFTDLTNGEDSYGGGRFIDLNIPAIDRLELDFNKAYNPLCAYNHGYSCPIPPKENHLEFRVEAGVKYKAEENE